jgi:hypothetical protein
MQKIKKPTCVGFFTRLVQPITLQQEQQQVQQQEQQQPVRKQRQQQEQQEQQLCHKQTRTEPTEQQRSEQRISFYFLQLINNTGVLNKLPYPFARASPVAKGAAFYHYF